MDNLSNVTVLDLDDLNFPGGCKFPQPQCDLSIDYSLFKVSKYSSSASPSERVKIAQSLNELALQLGKRHVSCLLPLISQ